MAFLLLWSNCRVFFDTSFETIHENWQIAEERKREKEKWCKIESNLSFRTPSSGKWQLSTFSDKMSSEVNSGHYCDKCEYTFNRLGFFRT